MTMQLNAFGRGLRLYIYISLLLSLLVPSPSQMPAVNPSQIPTIQESGLSKRPQEENESQEAYYLVIFSGMKKTHQRAYLIMAQGLLSMNAWHDALTVLGEEGARQKGRLPGCAFEDIESIAKPQDVEAGSAANIGECSSNRVRASGEHD